MTYKDFQAWRKRCQEAEIAERANDLTAPRPSLNSSIVDQALRELHDRVSALEAQAALKALAVKPPIAK